MTPKFVAVVVVSPISDKRFCVLLVVVVVFNVIVVVVVVVYKASFFIFINSGQAIRFICSSVESVCCNR